MKKLAILFYMFLICLITQAQDIIVNQDPFTGLKTISKGLAFKDAHIYFGEENYLVSNKIGKGKQVVIKVNKPSGFILNANQEVLFGIGVTIKDGKGKELLHINDIFEHSKPIAPEYLGSLSAKVTTDPNAKVGDIMDITVRFYDKLGNGEIFAYVQLEIAEESASSNTKENFNHYHSNPSYIVYGEHTSVYQSALYNKNAPIKNLVFSTTNALVFKADLSGFKGVGESAQIAIKQTLINKIGEEIYSNQKEIKTSERLIDISFSSIEKLPDDHYLWVISVTDRMSNVELGISQWLLINQKSDAQLQNQFVEFLKRLAFHEANGSKPFDANEILKNALALSPKDKAIHYRLGFNNISAGHYQAAIEQLKSAIELDPSYFDAHYELGYAYKQAKDYQDALTHFNKAITLNPTHYSSLYWAGWLYNDLKEYTKAIEILTQAVENNPQKRTSALKERAYAKRSLNDLAGAVADYRAITELDSKNPKAYYNLGYYSIDLKEYDHAIKAFTQAINLNPNDYDSYYERAYTYKMLKDYQKAIDDFKQVIRVAYGKEPSKTYLHLGDCFLALEKTDEACKNYLKAKTLGTKGAEDKLKANCR